MVPTPTGQVPHVQVGCPAHVLHSRRVQGDADLLGAQPLLGHDGYGLHLDVVRSVGQQLAQLKVPLRLWNSGRLHGSPWKLLPAPEYFILIYGYILSPLQRPRERGR